MPMTQRQASQRLTAWLPILLCALISATQAEDLEPGWSYRGEITSPGTRSEGFSGYLFYGCMPVPGKLAHLVTPIGTYVITSYSIPYTKLYEHDIKNIYVHRGGMCYKDRWPCPRQ